MNPTDDASILPEQQCIPVTQERSVEDVPDFTDLDDMFVKIKSMVTQNPYLKNSMAVMVSTFQKIQTTTALETAMSCFGKYGSRKRQTKRIPVSVAAVSRRLRRNCNGAGPVPKQLRRGDHNFVRPVVSSVLMPGSQRKPRTPHNLSHRVLNNIQ